MSVTLRPMSPADIPAVATLEEAAFGAEAWSPAMLAEELAAQPGTRYYLVAGEAGEIAGYGGLLVAGDQAEIVTLAVTPERWGEGIGTALLRGLTEEAVRRRCAELFLEVRVDNERAQRLYRRHGFEGIGVRRGYYQPSGTDALVMRRPLAATYPLPPPAAPLPPAAPRVSPAAPRVSPAVPLVPPTAAPFPGNVTATAQESGECDIAGERREAIP